MTTFDYIRVAVGGLLALAGAAVIIYSFIAGIMQHLTLAGFGLLFLLVGIVIARSNKDGHLAEAIFDFFRVL